MNITYEVKDIFMILIKKWYIILATMILFGIISYPINKIHNDNVKNNYNELTKVEDTNDDLCSGVLFYKVVINSVNDSEDDELAKIIAKNIVEFVQVNFYKSKSKKLNLKTNILDLDPNELSHFKITYMEGLPVLMITVLNAKEDIYNTYLDKFPKYIEDLFLNVTEESFKLEMVHEQIRIKDIADFNSIIMQRPQGVFKYRVMITASILGFIISVLLVLINDFRRTTKILRKEES